MNKDGKLIVDIFKEMEVFVSNGDMRRMVNQHAIKVNLEVLKTDNIESVFLINGYHLLQIGSCRYYTFEIAYGELKQWKKYSKEELI